MNEQQLTEFLTFCKQAIPEYKDLSLEQIAESLVQIQESDPETFQGILNSYKKAKQAFKRGGKLDAFVAKFANGGRSTKKCSCGCDLIKVAEKGGIVEKCACGCKNKVVKAQEGSEVEQPFVMKNTPLWLTRRDDMTIDGKPFKTTVTKNRRGVQKTNIQDANGVYEYVENLYPDGSRVVRQYSPLEGDMRLRTVPENVERLLSQVKQKYK